MYVKAVAPAYKDENYKIAKSSLGMPWERTTKDSHHHRKVYSVIEKRTKNWFSDS